MTCDLLVEQKCENHRDGLHEHWRVKQSCTATVAGDSVKIRSSIDRIEEATHEGVAYTHEEREGYTPDNFDMVISKPGIQMMGRTVDGQGGALTMIFQREAGRK